MLTCSSIGCKTLCYLVTILHCICHAVYDRVQAMEGLARAPGSYRASPRHWRPSAPSVPPGTDAILPTRRAQGARDGITTTADLPRSTYDTRRNGSTVEIGSRSGRSELTDVSTATTAVP